MIQTHKRNRHRQIGYPLLAFALLLALISALIVVLHQEREEEIQRRQSFAQYEKTLREQQQHVDDCYQSVLASIKQEVPGIVCWGDSLTVGTGGEGITYPLVLDQLIQKNICQSFEPAKIRDVLLIEKYNVSIPVQNMGVEGESTPTILGRAGGVPYVLSEALDIPGEKTPIPIQIRSQNGSKVAPLRQGTTELEVFLKETEGLLTLDKGADQYYFTRSSAGDPIRLEAGASIFTKDSLRYASYLPIVWMGQNGGWDTADTLIAQQRSIVALHTQNADRYLILGLTTGTAESRSALEAAMTEAFGDHFLNLRDYFSTKGLGDAGLSATEEDLAAMSQGAVPASLLSDEIHLNATGYELVGKQVYQRMLELGYFNAVLNTIDQCMQTAN